MTKSQIVKELKRRSIAFDADATKKDLEKLLNANPGAVGPDLSKLKKEDRAHIESAQAGIERNA